MQALAEGSCLVLPAEFHLVETVVSVTWGGRDESGRAEHTNYKVKVDMARGLGPLHCVRDRCPRAQSRRESPRALHTNAGERT